MKKSYVQLLKEAILEYDAKSMDYKGPMTDPILSYEGDGEMETNRDASSILERYYFNEKKEKLIEQDSDVELTDAEDPNEIVTGEEPDDIDETMDDFEDEILDEDLELEELELEDYEPGDPDIVAKDEPLDVEDVVTNEITNLENTIIEKLIREMEDEGEKEGETKEAGTSLADEDEVDDILEAELLDELEDEETNKEDELDDEDKNKEDEDDLDIDKEVKSEGAGMGPIRARAARELEESFKIFKEQIEGEEEKVEDDDLDKDELEDDDDLVKEMKELEEDDDLDKDELEDDDLDKDELEDDDLDKD